jgi:tetratricopeptide (TPR) repeat protein
LLRYFGVLSHRQENFNSAIAYYRQALEIVILQRKQTPTDEGWAFQEAEIHNIFGETYLELKDFSTSCRELALSLSQYRTLSEQNPKYRYFLADPLLNMGQWHFQQGDLEQAKPYYQDCLQLSRRDTTARALLHLAELAEVWGNVEDAIALASEAERVAGTEATSVRDRAARFKAQLLSQNQSSSQQ